MCKHCKDDDKTYSHAAFKGEPVKYMKLKRGLEEHAALEVDSLMRPEVHLWILLIWSRAGASQTSSPRQQRLQQPDGNRPRGLRSQTGSPSPRVWERARNQQVGWGKSWEFYVTQGEFFFYFFIYTAQVLTVLQNQRRKIFVRVRRSAELHQTAVRIWRLELTGEQIFLRLAAKHSVISSLKSSCRTISGM